MKKLDLNSKLERLAEQGRLGTTPEEVLAFIKDTLEAVGKEPNEENIAGFIAGHDLYDAFPINFTLKQFGALLKHPVAQKLLKHLIEKHSK